MVKGETTLTVELTDDTYYEAMVYPIIKKLDSTTVVVGDVLEPQTHNIGMFEGPYTDPEDVAIRLTDKGEYLVELFVANAGEGNSAYGYIRIEDDKGPEQPAPQPAPQPGQLVAKPTASKVLVDQKPVDFEAYTIENSNYIKLRDFAYAVNQSKKQFQVSWDSEKSAINLISNTPYSPSGSELKKGKGQVKTPVINQSKIYKDQKEINLKAYTIDGNNYFKLRDLAKEFDIAVTWDGATSTIGIDTSL